MYFLEFDELNSEGEYIISLPIYVKIDVELSDDEAEDEIPYQSQENLVNSCIKSLLDPIIKFIGSDPNMKLDEEEYDFENTYVSVSCMSNDVNSCVDKLVAKCQELDGTFIEDEQEFDLDREIPYVTDHIYGYTLYKKPYRWSSEEEEYEYYHARLKVKVTFEYDKRNLEIYRK